MIYFGVAKHSIKGFERINKRGQKKPRIDPKLWYVVNMTDFREPVIERLKCWSEKYAKLLIKLRYNKKYFRPISGEYAIDLKIPIKKGHVRRFSVSEFKIVNKSFTKLYTTDSQKSTKFFVVKHPQKNRYYFHIGYSRFYFISLLANKGVIVDKTDIRVVTKYLKPNRKYIIIPNPVIANLAQTSLILKICQKNYKLRYR